MSLITSLLIAVLGYVVVVYFVVYRGFIVSQDSLVLRVFKRAVSKHSHPVEKAFSVEEFLPISMHYDVVDGWMIWVAELSRLSKDVKTLFDVSSLIIWKLKLAIWAGRSYKFTRSIF